MNAAIRIALALGAVALAGAALAQPDPLGSARWEDMNKAFFAGTRVEFDPRVRVTAPTVAENPLNVPVRVDASELKGVEEVLVIADFNPIVKALSFQPARALPSLAFRLKLQQSTPVRAAARTADGVWHLGGTWVDTAGGGCTQPSTGSTSPLWQQHLNQVSARRWQSSLGERLRFSVVHPMDTGLAAGIPAFHLEDLLLADAEGRALMHIQPFEPVAENPLFSIDLPAEDKPGPIRISGRDNNGNLVDAWVGR
ncbi:MAG: quinoprotein dehydrogenase-associated SoxYZ-like carrier [Actinomycetota bacterium]